MESHDVACKSHQSLRLKYWCNSDFKAANSYSYVTWEGGDVVVEEGGLGGCQSYMSEEMQMEDLDITKECEISLYRFEKSIFFF